jgi:hypothetical protein
VTKHLKHTGRFVTVRYNAFMTRNLLTALFSTVRTKFVLTIVLILVIATELHVLGGPSGKSAFTEASVIVEKCSKAPYKPTCYEEEIPRLMSALSMEETFEVTREVQNIDTSYQYCHVLGHKLSANETAKDPSEWQSVIQRCPSGVCSNGCIHGAFQERFRKESLTSAELEELQPQLTQVCEAKNSFNPTGIEQASCYHALGHLLMYVTDADVTKSLDLCRDFAKKGLRDYSHICYDGVFMQIYQPLEPDDFELIKGKEIDASEVKEFCRRFKGEEQSSCWSESWPLSKEQILASNGTTDFCSFLQSQKEKDRCFVAVTYVMTAQFGFDLGKIKDFCSAMSFDVKANCFAQAASRFIETDYRNASKSVELCEMAAPYDTSNICFNELLKYSTYNFHPGSPAFDAYCAAFPKEWRAQCFQREELI